MNELVVSLNEDGIPRAHFYLEVKGAAEFTLPPPEGNILRSLLNSPRHIKPLSAIGTQVIENVHMLRIGGHRPMYVIIAQRVSGLVGLAELLPQPLSTKLLQELMTACIGLGPNQSCLREIHGDMQSAFEALTAALGAVNGNSISFFEVFELGALPDPTRLAMSPCSTRAITAGPADATDRDPLGGPSGSELPADGCGT